MNKLPRAAVIVMVLFSLLTAGIGCSKSAPSTTTSSPPATTKSVSLTTTSVPLTTTSVPPYSSISTIIPTSPSTTTPSSQPGTYDVHIYWNMVYDSLTVPVGSTVRFILVNGPDPSHPLGWDPVLDFAVSTSGTDTVYTYTFTKTGIYNYYCVLHGITGTLTVK